jgi:hypothetical protein
MRFNRLSKTKFSLSSKARRFGRMSGGYAGTQGVISFLPAPSLDPEMVEDTVKIVRETIRDKIQVNLIINNRTGGNAPLIAQKIAEGLHSKEQQRLFYALPHRKNLTAEFPPYPNHAPQIRMP